MYNTSLRMIGIADDAEDVMQEAFLSAFKKINDYSGVVSFGAWLKKIVINQTLDFLKANRPIFEEVTDTIENNDNVDSEIDISLTVQKVRNAISRLPEGYRIVLSLFLIEGYNHSEISQIINISESASRSQLTRAKRKLLEILKQDT